MPPLTHEAMGQEIHQNKQEAKQMLTKAQELERLHRGISVAVDEVGKIDSALEDLKDSFFMGGSESDDYDQFNIKFTALKAKIATIEAATGTTIIPPARTPGHGTAHGHGATAHGATHGAAAGGHGTGHGHGGRRGYYFESLGPVDSKAGGTTVFKDEAPYGGKKKYEEPPKPESRKTAWEEFKARAMSIVSVRDSAFRTLGVAYKAYGIKSGDKAWMDAVTLPVGVALWGTRDLFITKKFDYTDKFLEFNDVYSYLRGKYQTSNVSKEVDVFLDQTYDKLGEAFQESQRLTPEKFKNELSTKRNQIVGKMGELKNKIAGATFLDQNAKELLLARLQELVGSFDEKVGGHDNPFFAPDALLLNPNIPNEILDKKAKFKAAIASYMIAKTHGMTIAKDWVNFGAKTIGYGLTARMAFTGATWMAGKFAEHVQQNKMMKETRPRVKVKSGHPDHWINANAPKGPISWGKDLLGSTVQTLSGVARTLSFGMLRFGPKEQSGATPIPDNKRKMLDYRTGRPLSEKDRVANYKKSWERVLVALGIAYTAWHATSHEDVNAEVAKQLASAQTPQAQQWMNNIGSEKDNSPAAVDSPYYSGPASPSSSAPAPVVESPAPMPIPQEVAPTPEVKPVVSEMPEGFKGHEAQYNVLKNIRTNIAEALKTETGYTVIDHAGVLNGLITKAQVALDKKPALFDDVVIKKALDGNAKETVAERFTDLFDKLNKNGDVVYDDQENILLGLKSGNIEEFEKEVNGKMYTFIVVKGVGSHAASISSTAKDHMFYSSPTALIDKDSAPQLLTQ